MPGSFADAYIEQPGGVPSGTIINPMTSLGDMIYGDVGGTPSRFPGNPSTTREFLSETGDGVNGAEPVWVQPTEGDLSLSNVNTNNATTLRHGFLPQLSNVPTQFLNGQGVFTTVSAGAAAGYFSQSFTNQTSVNVVHNLNGYPEVQILDNSKNVMVPLSIVHNSVNDFTVNFSVSSSGTILLTLGSPGIPAISTQVANYLITANDNVILSNGVITITLPTAVGIAGRSYTIKRIYAGGFTTIATTSSQTIDGGLTLVLANIYDSATVVSDGANWSII